MSDSNTENVHAGHVCDEEDLLHHIDRWNMHAKADGCYECLSPNGEWVRYEDAIREINRLRGYLHNVFKECNPDLTELQKSNMERLWDMIDDDDRGLTVYDKLENKINNLIEEFEQLDDKCKRLETVIDEAHTILRNAPCIDVTKCSEDEILSLDKSADDAYVVLNDEVSTWPKT